MSQAHFSVTETTLPTIEPVSIDYVKQWCRIDDSSMDQQIGDLITTARQMCSEYMGRAFINTVYTMKMDLLPIVPNSQYTPGTPWLLSPAIQNNWPLDPSVWAIKVPRSPLVSVASFTYIQGGVTQTLAGSQYLVDASSEPGRISPANGASWPGPDWQPNSVSIQFTAGYGTTQASVPAKFRMAIAFMVGALFDNPNGGIDAMPCATRSILDNNIVAEKW